MKKNFVLSVFMSAVLIVSLSFTSYAKDDKKSDEDFSLLKANYDYEEGTPDKYEPEGDEIGMPMVLMQETGTIGESTMIHNIHNQDDVDVFAFPVYSRYRYTIELKNIPENCDYDIELYNAMDVENSIAISDNKRNSNEEIVMELEPGFYYVEVSSYRGFSNENYSFSIKRK